MKKVKKHSEAGACSPALVNRYMILAKNYVDDNGVNSKYTIQYRTPNWCNRFSYCKRSEKKPWKSIYHQAFYAFIRYWIISIVCGFLVVTGGTVAFLFAGPYQLFRLSENWMDSISAGINLFFFAIGLMTVITLIFL